MERWRVRGLWFDGTGVFKFLACSSDKYCILAHVSCLRYAINCIILLFLMSKYNATELYVHGTFACPYSYLSARTRTKGSNPPLGTDSPMVTHVSICVLYWSTW